MRHYQRKVLAFLSLSLVGLPAYGVDHTRLLAGAQHLCQFIVAELRAYDQPNALRMVDGELDSLIRRLPKLSGRRAELRQELLAYADRQVAQGRTRYHGHREGLGILSMTAHDDFTAADYRRALDVAESEAKYVERIPGGPMATATPRELGITPKSRELRRLVDAFMETGTPIILVDLEANGEIHTSIAAQSMAPFVPPEAVEIPEVVGRSMHQCILDGLAYSLATFQYAYFPRPFIWKARYLHSPSARSDIVHEMGHAVQYHTWDLRLAVDRFVTLFKPFPEQPLDIYRRSLESKAPVATHYEHSVATFASSLPEYHSSIVRYARAAGLDEVEWLLFMQYLKLLKELDSHQHQGRWFSEPGMVAVHSLQEHGLFSRVLNRYTNANQIHVAANAVFAYKEAETLALVETLNDPANARRP